MQPLPNFAEVAAVAAERGLHLSLKTLGPGFRVVARDGKQTEAQGRDVWLQQHNSTTALPCAKPFPQPLHQHYHQPRRRHLMWHVTLQVTRVDASLVLHLVSC